MKKKLFLAALALCTLGTFSANADAAAKVTYREYTLGSNIEMLVPYVEGMNDKGAESALNKRFFDSSKSFLAGDKENKSPLMNDKFTFRAFYEVPFNDLGYLSVVQSFYSFTGGAHGNTTYNTLTYNTETGMDIGLKDVFKEGTDYRALLTTLVKEELATRGEKAEGFTFEQVDDTTLFYLTPSGLVLLFPPYKIAPYVAGDIRVHIPWWKLYEQLNPAIPVH